MDVRSGGKQQMLGKKGQESGQEHFFKNSAGNPKPYRKQSYWNMPTSHFVP